MLMLADKMPVYCCTVRKNLIYGEEVHQLAPIVHLLTESEA